MESQKSKNPGVSQPEKTQSDNFKEIFKRYNQYQGSRLLGSANTNAAKGQASEINSTRQKNAVVP